ncbi:MAG: SGNH/GDSL hydrolase family protein [Clostridia bacterium]|nr:SGNH/GDSL hydrolase family protein [Clostridia bacterium]
MDLKGKKIAFLGDSITEGCGVSGIEKVYWNLVAERTGAQCFGYGIGGTRIAPQKNIAPGETDLYYGSRVDSMIPDADVVVVFGGTNDFGHGDAPFGEIDSTDEKTFCGAFHALCRKLIEKYPEAQLVIMTPTHRDSEDFGPYNERGLRLCCNLEGYVDAIIKIAGFYAIPVLDLFRVSGIQSRVPVLKEKYIPDGLHPNDAGHVRIADKLIGFLNTL